MLAVIVGTSESMIAEHVKSFVLIVSPDKQEGYRERKDVLNPNLQRTLNNLSVILSVLFPKSPDSLLTYHPALARDCLCIQVLLMKQLMETGKHIFQAPELPLISVYSSSFCLFFFWFTEFHIPSAFTFNWAHTAGKNNLWIWMHSLRLRSSLNSELSCFHDVVNVDETHVDLQCNSVVTQIPYYIIPLTHLSSSILKGNFLVGFLTWLLLWESCSRQPVWWVKNGHLSSRENSYLHFLHRSSSTEGLSGIILITVSTEKSEEIQPQAFWGL